MVSLWLFSGVSGFTRTWFVLNDVNLEIETSSVLAKESFDRHKNVKSLKVCTNQQEKKYLRGIIYDDVGKISHLKI